MKCRICGRELTERDRIANVVTDVNRLYKNPVDEDERPGIFGFCERCKMGYLEYALTDDHYKEYNLLEIDGEEMASGGNAPLKGGYYDRVLRRLSSLCSSPESFLDVGCGQGTVMGYAKQYYKEVKGVEPSEVECRIAEKQGFSVERTFFDKNWKETGFSSFVMTQVLEHLPNPREALEVVYYTLMEGGSGYIDVPNGYGIYLNNYYYDVYAEHINYWSIRGLVSLLSDCGFYVVSAEEVHGGYHLAAYVVKKRRSGSFDEKRAYNWERMMELTRKNRVGVWGAGVKGRLFMRHVTRGGENSAPF